MAELDSDEVKSFIDLCLTPEVSPEKVEAMPIEKISYELSRMGVNQNRRLPEKIKNLIWRMNSDRQSEQCEIPEILITEILEAIALRDMTQIRNVLDKLDHNLVWLSPANKNAANLLYLNAQLIDFDSRLMTPVEKTLARFKKQVSDWSSLDTVYLMLAEGLIHLHRESYDQAIAHFTYGIGKLDSSEANLIADTRYYLSRAYWKKGIYGAALTQVRKAKNLHTVLDNPKRVAVIEIIEAWLLFLLGETEYARQVLNHAEEELSNTKDCINHGNILSFYGRLEKHDGKFDEALKCYFEAIKKYQLWDSQYHHIGRTHVNIGIVYYLKARKLAQYRGSEEEIEKLCIEAFERLKAAENIYNNYPKEYYRDRGKMHIAFALLYAFRNEISKAQEESEKALSLGEVRGDAIMMARAKITQIQLEKDLKIVARLAESLLPHAQRIENQEILSVAALCREKELAGVAQDSPEEGYRRLHEVQEVLALELVC